MDRFLYSFSLTFGAVFGVGFAMGLLAFLRHLAIEAIESAKQWNIERADTRHAREYRSMQANMKYWKECAERAGHDAEHWRKKAGGGGYTLA